ncbi:hypothetical protein N7520_007441 [Penicillium odoratum]|uniref:uncharacterized protein n=1 Tax=Penicillium odoratum TaxID=1167516 RepID=UPI002547038F|nr:uncharacterized protein N7520_007441 [Penicillium odoratum]KAJ5760285.1 hypothetical protein N7520_007441 [Penicillium odoratum]
MSWNRVIQDSDEEEPLVEDDCPVSPGPLPGPEYPIVQHYDYAAAQETYPTEHTATESFPGPQLNVNFDQFLQSQGTHGESTSSQQQREERWIPSANEGGGGSIRAMMTEIGIAQERLFEDQSSAAQDLPSTATHYPSEISQPGSFPALQPYQHQQMNTMAHDRFAYNEMPQNAPYEATQLLAPGVAPAYDYSAPAASTHFDSPSHGFTGSSSIHTVGNLPGVSSNKTLQVPQPMQLMACSPHDTEPLSSMASPGLNQTNDDSTRSGLVSLQNSPASTYDELALPAVYVQVSSAVKCARQTKQLLPEDDDDDELAIGDLGPSPSKPTQRKSPGRSPQPDPTEISNECIPENGITSGDVAPGADGQTAVGELSSATGKINNPNMFDNTGDLATKEPKKKKTKRTKAAVAAKQKSRVPDTDDDDDVICVDCRPLETETQEQSETVPNSAIADSDKFGAPQPDPTASTEGSSNTAKSGDKPAPKKRGRKRKKPSEETPEAAPVQALEQAPASESGVSNSNLTLADEVSDSKDETKPVEADDLDQPQADHQVPQNNGPHEALPQTPQKPDHIPSTPITGNSTNTRKGPPKHSPISSTSNVPLRVGLSKRARIAPLLKIVRKS